jgi:hypothetical protein
MDPDMEALEVIFGPILAQVFGGANEHSLPFIRPMMDAGHIANSSRNEWAIYNEQVDVEEITFDGS